HTSASASVGVVTLSLNRYCTANASNPAAANAAAAGCTQLGSPSVQPPPCSSSTAGRRDGSVVSVRNGEKRSIHSVSPAITAYGSRSVSCGRGGTAAVQAASSATVANAIALVTRASCAKP